MPVGTLGLLIGLVLGFALIVGNFGDMLIVALFGALGYGIHKIVIGDLDLGRLTGNRRDR
jgi:hypothetical protein